jgi:tetratricopeptide (TPR) repeat protein
VLWIQWRQNQASVARLEQQVDLQIAERDYSSAYQSLKRLVVLKPEDNRCKLKLALCADQLAKDSKGIQEAIRLNMTALSICQANPELETDIPVIRRRLVKRMSEFGNYEDAIDQISRLVSQDVDLELQRYYTVAKTRLWLDGRGYQMASGLSGNLPNWFASLVQMPPVDLLVKTHVEVPEDFEVAGLLVNLCLGDPEKLSGSFLAGDSKESLRNRAQAIVDRLVASRSKDPFTWLLRYEISSRDNKLGLSEEDIESAVQLGPDNPKVLLVAGKLYLDRADRAQGLASKQIRSKYLERALEILRQAVALDYKDAELFLMIGNILLLQDHPEQAIQTWRDGKRVCTDRVSQLDFRIAETLIDLDQLQEAREALQAMDQSIRSERASLNRATQLAFLRKGRETWSKYHLASGDYPLAIQTLQVVIAGGQELDAINQAAVYASLGDCYLQLGQPDRAATSFEQAILLSPNNQDYRRKSASAWLIANRYAESYKQWMLVEPKSASDWFQICDVILQMQARAEQDSGYWFVFDKGISEIRRLSVIDSSASERLWSLEIMQIDASILRAPEASRSSVIDNAADQLWFIAQSRDFAPEIVRAAVVRWKAWGQQGYLSKIIETLSQSADHKQPALARAELLALSGNDTLAQGVLEETLKAKPQDEQVLDAISRMRIVSLPAAEAIREIRKLKKGAWPLARRLAWRTLKRPIILTEAQERDPQARKKRFQDWLIELETYQDLLKEFEGPEGTEWRYLQGRRLMAQSAIGEQSNEIELLDIAGYLDRKRTEWPETHLLAGMVAESQGNNTRAIREYNYALQYGNQDLDTHERLVKLLYQQGLFAEARVAIDRLGDRAFASRSIAAVSLQLASESAQDQIALAEAGTRVRPSDPMAWVWLSQIIELQSRGGSGSDRTEAVAKAEANLEKAAQIAKKNDLRIPMARFNFYRATRNEQGQQSVLEQIQQSKEFEPSLQTIAVAQIYESLGKFDQAIENYRKAITLGANELELQTRIAQILVNDNRLEEAIACLKTTLERHPQDAATRRRLATLLANRSYDEDWQQIAQLLSPNSKSNSPEDVRLQIILLSQKNDLENLQKAQLLLERIVELPGVRTEEDHLQLASLYLRVSRLLELAPGREIEAIQTKEAAGRQLKIVTSSANPKPEQIYTYADYLIQQKRFFDAVEESQKLQALAPGAFPTVLLAARIEKIEGKQELAKKTILAWLEEKRQLEGSVGNEPKIAQYLVQAGQAMQILGEPQESQKFLKEAFQLDKRAGVNYIRSILLTDDSSTRNNAVRFLMDRLKSEGNKESAVLLSLLVRKGDTDDDLIASAQKQLVDFSVSQQDDRVLLQSLADLWVWRGDESQAIETFRRIVQDRPNDVIALNNLAMLLADSPNNSQDALAYVNRAIELIGAKSSLMDTKAYVLLRLGRYSEAINILSTLMAKNNSPSVQFHLYQAYSKNNQADLAKETLAKLDFEQLRKTPLTRADQQVVDAIAQD